MTITDTGDKVATLKHLANGRMPAFVAAAVRASEDDVVALGKEYGWPDRTRLQYAVDELDGKPARSSRPTTPVAPARVGGKAGDQELLELPLDRVAPDPENAREDVGDVSDLAASLAEAGLLQPIVVRHATDDQLVIVAGHRRYAAAQLLGWATIAAIVRRAMRPDDVLAAMLIENGQRAGLDPIEEARALRRLQVQAGGITQAELARRIGRGQMHISSRLALLALPVEEQELVRAGQMTLVEATHRGHIAGGTVKPKGQDKNWHLGPQHALATRAKARCQHLGHKRGRTIGGMACGACWESVIRADERHDIQDRLAKTGTCPVCDNTQSHP